MKLLVTAPAAQALDPALRRRLYGGEILKQPARPASLALTETALDLLRRELGCAWPESLHEIWSPSRLHAAISHVRRHCLSDAALNRSYAALLSDLGVEAEAWRVDQPRLRAVIPGAERVPAAAPMYYAHRDTWYANSPSQLNLWIPLGDYPAAQTFVFWPERFGQPVANDSAGFDYARWQREAGFQNPAPAAGSVYPRALELPPEAPLGFDCHRGELLLFSAAQLHMTLPNPGPGIRFSLDLRLVCRQDQAQGLGAADGDNASTGSTLDEYAYLQAHHA